MNVINIPRDEAIALVQEAVERSRRPLSAAEAILLKRQAEQAPMLSFGLTTQVYQNKPCACPAVRAGMELRMGSNASYFASAFDHLVCARYGLHDGDDGVLVIEG